MKGGRRDEERMKGGRRDVSGGGLTTRTPATRGIE